MNRHLLPWKFTCALLVGPLLAVGAARAQTSTPAAAPAPTPVAVMEMPAPSEPAPSPASPYDGSLMERSALSGNWCGWRDDLLAHGFKFDIYNTNYYQGVASGGLQDQFLFGGRNDILLNIDGEKAGLWKGLFITLHDETLYGASVNTFTGALSPVSLGQNVPVPNGPVTALTAVKVTQALSENFITFGGKLNLLDEFKQPYAAGSGVDTFWNTSICFNAALARTVPLSTYGGGFAILAEGQPIVTVMVLDTNNTPTTIGFNSFFDNGATFLGQLSIPVKPMGLPGHQGIGFSYSSGSYTQLDPSAFELFRNLQAGLPLLGKTTGSWAAFYAMDQTLWVDPQNPKRSWGLFGSAAYTDGNPNPVRTAATFGVGGSVPFCSRPLDTFGVAVYYLGISSDLKNLAPRVLPLRDETGVELFYDVGVAPWLHITPDLQFIDPIRSRVESSVVLGVRAKIDF